MTPSSAGRRALVTGAGGFLGGNLCVYLARRGWTVWGAPHGSESGLKDLKGLQGLDAFKERALDICVPSAVESIVSEARPNVIFHLAAIANPDACAADEPAARQINVQGAKIVATAARRAGARVIFVSTDQVFDGTRPLWKEDDIPSPLGAYGRSKRDAEKAVLEAAGEASLIVRLALTYGWGRGAAKGRNFSEQWLRALLTGKPVIAFTDQWRTPIYGGDACEALVRGAEQGWSGLLHVAGPERTTRHDFATRLARAFGLPTEAVRAASLKDTVFRDPRPADASLDTTRLKSLGFEAHSLDQGIQAMHLELEQL